MLDNILLLRPLCQDLLGDDDSFKRKFPLQFMRSYVVEVK